MIPIGVETIRDLKIIRKISENNKNYNNYFLVLDVIILEVFPISLIGRSIGKILLVFNLYTSEIQ